MARVVRRIQQVSTLLLAVMLPAIGRAQSTGRVRGAIYDSLSNRPLRGATVFISGSTKLGISNDLGEFFVDSVPVGKQSVSYSTPLLDSLGLSGMISSVQVVANTEAALTLGVPSFATLWRTLCPRTLVSRTDSGIVYGGISNAQTDTRLRGARAVFSWVAMETNGKSLAMNRPVQVVRSDSLGNYVACGLPTDITVTAEVDAGPMTSNAIDFVLYPIRIAHRDFLVSTELVPAAATLTRSTSRMGAPTLAPSVRLRGTASVRGTVRDGNGVPQGNTFITAPSADTTTRTDVDGKYVLGGLPAGTQILRARKLGYGPQTVQVDLRPGQVTESNIALPAATVLAKVDVKAERASNVARKGFEERKKVGGGYFLTDRDIENRPDMVSVLQGLPSLRIQRRNMSTSITIERGPTVCVPSVYLDGRPSTVDELTLIRPEEVYGVEVYTHAAEIPAQFLGINQCGSLVIWTKNAK